MRCNLVLLIIIFILIINTPAADSSLVGWFLGRDTPPSTSEKNTIIKNEHAGKDDTSQIPFELSVVDEKFIADAQKYTDLRLSELDICQHKLILQLKQDCTELTEDELSKLGVNLLNCQSKREGRPVYPCLSGMTLGECTRDMDSDTWNAYHIMSNRARSVCYAARQQQFRALAQMTVNKLMASSGQQLEFIRELKAEQEELGSMAAETLGSLTKGQEKLMEQQHYLKATQQETSKQISATMRELSRERMAAYASQKQMSAITETLKDTLKQADQLAQEQGNERKAAQQQLLQSLNGIESRVAEFWNQLEASMAQLLSRQERAARLQSDTVETLLRINRTFQFLLKVSEQSKEQLDWILGLVGSTENQVGKLSTWILHLSYSLVGMLVLVFFQAPPHIRWIFLTLMLINLSMHLRQGLVLELPALGCLVAALSLAYQLLKLINNRCTKLDESDSPIAEDLYIRNRSSTPKRCWDGSLSVPEDGDETMMSFAYRRSSRIARSTALLEMPSPASINQSVNQSKAGTSRRKCLGKCVDGSNCRKVSMKDSLLCWQHKSFSVANC